MRLRNIKNKELYAKIRKGKILLVLLGCLLLAGCQEETESEEQQTDISENSVVEADKEELTYSPKNSIQDQIMSGNFEHLNNDSEYVASIEKTYDWVVNELGEYEWRQLDLNGDGIEDLILQRKKVLRNWEHKLILGIFACEKDGASCILWDSNDMSEYFFCGPTGEIMYMAASYVPIVSFEPYKHCHYDREWNLVTDYELVVYKVDTEEGMKEYPQQVEEWQQEHPDMAEDGVYYRKYTDAGVEILTREELENIYERETGYEFYSSFY